MKAVLLVMTVVYVSVVRMLFWTVSVAAGGFIVWEEVIVVSIHVGLGIVVV